jgi:hypothetical protein
MLTPAQTPCSRVSRRRFYFWLCLPGLALSLSASMASAQTAAATPAPATGTSTSRPDALWRCTLPGGEYLVALRSIASISTHEYIVDGAAQVTELTVATNSSVEARFYYLEPVTNSSTPALGTASTLQAMQQHVYDLATSQAGGDPVWEKVIKNYPATTHAHTVEYRLSTKENLQQIYQSLEQAWTTGKGANLTTQ